MIKRFHAATMILALAQLAWGAADAKTLGLRGDGVTDDTATLQKALDAGQAEIVFPRGVYLLGTVNVPGNVTLRGEAGAVIQIHVPALKPYRLDSKASDETNPLSLFALHGQNIRLDGFSFDFRQTEKPGIKADQRPDALITGDQCANITLANLVACRPEPAKPLPVNERRESGVGASRYPKLPPEKESFDLAHFRNSENLLLESCSAAFMRSMLRTYQCSRIVANHNRAEDCYAITECRSGDMYLRHTGNWSRSVTHQCRWWGGNANDSRKLKEGDPGWATATTVHRGVYDKDSDFNRYTAGAFDILVADNYAEYGQTLAWGAKGRQIIFKNNIGRFFSDYALGSEGGENVLFDGNVVINGMSGGLTTMYWAEKVVMTNNIVLTRDEPIDMRYCGYSSQKGYQGLLIRMHYAGSPSGSGAGQVLISNNLLACELPGESRSIALQAGRDVQITGNKIRNGRIAKRGGGRLFIDGNDFTMTVSESQPWINMPTEPGEVVISNNQFRSAVETDKRSPTEVLMLMETGAKLPALRMIENNHIDGFPLAVWMRSFSAQNQARYVIRNNTVGDGAIRIEGLEASRLLSVQGNISARTLQNIQPEMLLRNPAAMPAPVQAPEQKKGQLSDEQRNQDSHDVK